MAPLTHAPLGRQSCTPRVHLRAATASSHLHVQMHVGITEVCSRRKVLIPWPGTLSHSPATSTRSLRRNHTCDRSPRRHSFRLYMHQAHNHQCFRTLSSVHHFRPEIRKCNLNCDPCAHRRNFRAGRNCGHQRRRNRLFTHTHRSMMGNTPNASQMPEPISITAFAVPSKENSSKQWKSEAPVVAQHAISREMRR